jgi:hypothetical protein
MKLKNILTGALLLALATSARADVTIEITGATAFRGASNQSILNAFASAGGLGTTFNYAHEAAAGSLNTANRAIFVGTFPGVSGTTTIRTSWNGSTEGIRAVALGGAFNPTFLTAAAITAPGENPNKTSPTNTVHPKFSFSDVRQSSSPITSPTLSPADARVGVVTFAMVANEGAPANLTNTTSQQLKALNAQGFQPLSLFTGNAADNGTFVFATGRNDGSGTRTSYLGEIGYGIANPVNQYIATVSTATAIQTIRRVPAGNGANASTLWGNDIDGNGGYSSSSSNRTDMGKTTAVTDVLDADNSVLLDDANILLISWLPTNDAANAAAAGAKILAFNGVQITPTVSGLTAADKAKVTEGAYSAWNYQNLYYRGTLATDENTVYTAIKNGIPAALGASGIALGDMNVSRPDDGAPIAP